MTGTGAEGAGGGGGRDGGKKALRGVIDVDGILHIAQEILFHAKDAPDVE